VPFVVNGFYLFQLPRTEDEVKIQEKETEDEVKIKEMPRSGKGIYIPKPALIK